MTRIAALACNPWNFDTDSESNGAEMYAVHSTFLARREGGGQILDKVFIAATDLCDQSVIRADGYRDLPEPFFD